MTKKLQQQQLSCKSPQLLYNKQWKQLARSIVFTYLPYKKEESPIFILCQRDTSEDQKSGVEKIHRFLYVALHACWIH